MACTLLQRRTNEAAGNSETDPRSSVHSINVSLHHGVRVEREGYSIRPNTRRTRFLTSPRSDVGTATILREVEVFNRGDAVVTVSAGNTAPAH